MENRKVVVEVGFEKVLRQRETVKTTERVKKTHRAKEVFCSSFYHTLLLELKQSLHQLPRMEELNRRIAAAEKRLEVVEAKVNDPVERVKRDLAVKKIYNARFVTVHSKYYELSLEERASLMHCNVPQLCKSIIFENTMCDHNDMGDVTNSRYYIVIIQYISKFHILMHIFVMVYAAVYSVYS